MSTKAKAAENPVSLISTVLEVPPCCIEFCPSRRGLFLVGCYQLEDVKATGVVEDAVPGKEASSQVHDAQIREDGIEQPGPRQRRSGSLVLFRLAPETAELTMIQDEPTPYAVLDLHFHPSDTTLVGVAFSEGRFGLYRLKTDGEPAVGKLDIVELDADPNVLMTSFAWAPSSVLSDLNPHEVQFAATFSSGDVCLYSLDVHSATVSDLRRISLQSHSLEAWIVSFARTTVSHDLRILSGGDDMHINSNNLTCSATPWPDNDGTSSRFRARGHDAGITAILPLGPPLDDQGTRFTFLTGSYDEYVRVCTMNSPSVGPRVLAEKRLGGGVWRLRTVSGPSTEIGPPSRYTVLASCMHAGVRVLEIIGQANGDGSYAWSIAVVAEFEEHESMNYGSDWQPVSKPGTGKAPLVVSTSFYDRKLCVWALPDSHS